MKQHFFTLTAATLFHATGLKTARANELYFYNNKKNYFDTFFPQMISFSVFFLLFWEDELGFFFVSDNMLQNTSQLSSSRQIQWAKNGKNNVHGCMITSNAEINGF